MTALLTPPDELVSDAPVGTDRGGFPVRSVISAAVLILSSILLGFAVYFGLISRLHYDRAQHLAYDDFRTQLALGTAPVGPTRPDDPSRLLDPGTAVAVLNIPEIGLRAVVFEGTSGAVLENGPGHLRDTVLPGQSGTSEIMGRADAYGGPFGRLDRMRAGDTFTVTTGQGVADFRVIDVRHAGDRMPAPVAAGQGRLILVTGYGPPFFPSDVLHVDAALVTPAQLAPGAAFTVSDLPPQEKAMATEPVAWVSLVLWGFGLVVAVLALAWCRWRWRRWQIWIVAVPALGFLGLAAADQLARLLPNLM